MKQYPFIILIQHRHYLVKRYVTENITLPLLGHSNICIYFSFGFICMEDTIIMTDNSRF